MPFIALTDVNNSGDTVRFNVDYIAAYGKGPDGKTELILSVGTKVPVAESITMVDTLIAYASGGKLPAMADQVAEEKVTTEV